MIPVIEEQRGELEAPCVRCRVRRLAVFGSAATGPFDPCVNLFHLAPLFLKGIVPQLQR